MDNPLLDQSDLLVKFVAECGDSYHQYLESIDNGGDDVPLDHLGEVMKRYTDTEISLLKDLTAVLSVLLKLELINRGKNGDNQKQ